MIMPLLTALLLQVPDPATAAMRLWELCRSPPPEIYGRSNIQLAGGLPAEVVISIRGCTLEAPRWSDDGGALVTEVRRRLQALDQNWQVEQWREQIVNESGPRRWSRLRLAKGPDDRTWTLRILEPEAGASRSLVLLFEKSE